MNKERILSTIRGYIFDRYPVHSLTLGEEVDSTFSLSSSRLKVVKPATSTGGTPTDVLDVDMTDKTWLDVFESLLGAGINTAFTGSYRGDEPISSVIAMTNVAMTSELKLYTKTFYNENTILDFIRLYLTRVLDYPEAMTDAEMDLLLEEFTGRAYDHLCLYVAILLVDYRRIFAYAQTIFSGNIFADGSGRDLTSAIAGDLDNVTVNIGDVFSLQDGADFKDKYPTNDDGTSIGSENFFGDTDSFWYKLFLWLRDRLEQGFSDFTFRKNHGLWSKAQLDKPLSYFQYFDSYPYPEQTRQLRRGFSSERT